ncbi:MAG: radical SAM protein [Phycisphaerae bacterium]|nr:radical SAM protein [Phycisphaerae bacterium]
MEPRRRQCGDELLKPGEFSALRDRVRRLAAQHDVRTVIACAFDPRARMVPFYYSSVWIAPAGSRAIGAAMVDAGFAPDKTRIVLTQWNPNFQPTRMQVAGQPPDLFMISSMHIHSAACDRLIRDARRIPADRRPLIIVGGSKAIYSPWTLFEIDGAAGADVVVTGEEFVLLSLLEVVLSTRASGESMRSAFYRARDNGSLDGVPGLVYPRGPAGGPAEELVDTGVQRLLGDLDELPFAALGYQLLEPPSRRPTLASRPVPDNRVRRCTPISAITLTTGCRFACPYCPIPQYNQGQLRGKSGPRIVAEMDELSRRYGLKYFFGTDDNFFADRTRAVDICEAIVRAEFDGKPLRRRVRWATEVTVHDTLGMREHLKLVRRAGVLALWLGVEDMTGTLVKKGQSVDGTMTAMRLLRDHTIMPMPMLMYQESQPLYTPGSAYGLLNQIEMLRRAGAADVQVLTITPAPGARTYDAAHTSGQVIGDAAGRPVEPRMTDGNFVTASQSHAPWRTQLGLMAALVYFYNPLRLVCSLFESKTRRWAVDPVLQIGGFWSLVRSLPRMAAWALRLMRGPIRRNTTPPRSLLPVRYLNEAPAAEN